MLWAESSLLPAELRATFACINEKDLLSKVRILFTSLRSVNGKDSLSRVFFRGIDEA